ncbi:hypothetical protein V1279_003515 [Bradyrhizobium sp. AZCC 1610]|uniref:hypothetical protein n=1 Tax=Bradyrhizobium sp. AZCC 1610 TaxID=3117020 RepID=UPI002FF317DE
MATRAWWAASSRDENRRKEVQPHKNDLIASNTIDVRRCNFRCAHRTQAIERSAAAGMRFELRFAIRGDAWAVAKFSLVAR